MADVVAVAPLAVLHVFKYFRPDFTGEGIYLEKLSRQLAVLGIRSDVVTSTTRGAGGVLAPEGIGTLQYFGAGTNSEWHFNGALAGYLAMHAWRYEVVHFHSLIDRYFVLPLLARLARCRVVQSCTLDDGVGSMIASYRPSRRGLARRLMGFTDAVIAISPKLYDDSLGVMPASRVHLVPQGVEIPRLDDADRAAARARWQIGADDTVLLFVGGLCARKDIGFLIDNHPEQAGLHLLIVGPDLEDDYADAIRAGSAGRAAIRFLGYRDDPAEFYRMADLFVFASRSEGFGNVLLEAMAFGLAVVSRRLAGVTESFIDDGANGCLFDDAEQYVHAVRGLVADPARRAALGRAARQTVLDRFSLPAIAARYADIYRGAA